MKIILIPTMSFMTRLLKAIKLLVKHPYFHLFFILVFIFSSCSKPPGKIGGEIQPEQSKLDVDWSDTTTVYAYSLPDDSIQTDESVMGTNLLGSVMDPVFGSTVTGIYSQYKLSAPAPDFGENPILDSLVLHLLYQGDSYGDTSTPLIVHVYEILEGLEYIGDYYSNTIIPVASTDYADFQFVPLTKDSVATIFPLRNPPLNDTATPDTAILAPALRIPLSNITTELGYRFLNADTSVLKDSEAFIEFFKGLYCVTEPVNTGGSINYVNLLTGREHNTKMILYYHNVIDDTAVYDEFHFIIDPFTPRINKFEHDFTQAGSEFKSQVIDRDTTLGQQMFYSQGVAGVKTLVKFPFIRNWSNLGNIAINEAKLIFSGFETEPYNGAPAQLAMVEVQDDGTYLPIVDELEGQSYFGGRYKSSTNSYTFRITRHIQSLIDDSTKKDNGLAMFVRLATVNPERYIFNGNQPLSDTALPFRLEMIYTTLD